jgi:hypothetical protein
MLQPPSELRNPVSLSADQSVRERAGRLAFCQHVGIDKNHL